MGKVLSTKQSQYFDAKDVMPVVINDLAVTNAVLWMSHEDIFSLLLYAQKQNSQPQ